MLNIELLSNWGIPFKNTFVISGPCSAESERQVIETAIGLTRCNVSVFRAGIWKPRTRPGSFEGVGVEGLKWLNRVKDVTNLPVAVEVAYPEHVSAAIQHNVDVLWIGARTTANPFSVQAIAKELENIDIPVMIKNPINPDIELWIGALERIHNAGIRKLLAIHRGFSTYRDTAYRYSPNWKIPIELRRRFPHLPIICDPSHMAGKREYIYNLSQMAMDLLFDGLMIETHIDPEKALCDSQQQITPNELRELLCNIKFKRTSSSDRVVNVNINQLREKLDDIDVKIIRYLAKRMNLSRKIGKYKKENNLSIFQPDRWKITINSRIKMGREKDIREAFIFNLFELIHEESIRQQRDVFIDD